MPPVKRRAYDGEGRRAAAQRTRQAIIDAATELFVERGYSQTTMAAIAKRAGVAPDTVYASVGRKPMLFRLLTEVALSGTDQPVPAVERDEARRINEETDPARKVEIYAAAITRIQQRMGPLYRALQDAAAAEPELVEVWSGLIDRRARNMPGLIEEIHRAGALRSGLSADDAADAVWTLTSTEVYNLLTTARGWPAKRYEHWLASTVKCLLL